MDPDEIELDNLSNYGKQDITKDDTKIEKKKHKKNKEEKIRRFMIIKEI